MNTCTTLDGSGVRDIASPFNERLSELYSAHASNAVRLATLLTGDPDAAQDIAHEAFARLGSRFLALRDPERAAGYLYRTVANLAKGHGRTLGRDRRLKERLSATRPRPENIPPLGGAIWEALLQLPMRQRTALFLRHYLDMSEAEAAEAMSLSTAAMKSLTHRATEACRKHLEGMHHDAGT